MATITIRNLDAELQQRATTPGGPARPLAGGGKSATSCSWAVLGPEPPVPENVWPLPFANDFATDRWGAVELDLRTVASRR